MSLCQIYLPLIRFFTDPSSLPHFTPSPNIGRQPPALVYILSPFSVIVCPNLTDVEMMVGVAKWKAEGASTPWYTGIYCRVDSTRKALGSRTLKGLKGLFLWSSWVFYKNQRKFPDPNGWKGFLVWKFRRRCSSFCFHICMWA